MIIISFSCKLFLQDLISFWLSESDYINDHDFQNIIRDIRSSKILSHLNKNRLIQIVLFVIGFDPRQSYFNFPTTFIAG